MPIARHARTGVYALLVLAGTGLLANAGDLDPPPGPVAPTMVTLDELDTKLDSILAALGARADGQRGMSIPVDVYFTAQGIDGESVAVNHVDEVDLVNASVSVSGAPLAPGGVVSPRELDAFVISGFTDSALTQLMTHQTSGSLLRDARIQWCREFNAVEGCFLDVEISEAVVTQTRIDLRMGPNGLPEPFFEMRILPVNDVLLTYRQFDDNGNVVSTISNLHQIP